MARPGILPTEATALDAPSRKRKLDEVLDSTAEGGENVTNTSEPLPPHPDDSDVAADNNSNSDNDTTDDDDSNSLAMDALIDTFELDPYVPGVYTRRLPRLRLILG